MSDWLPVESGVPQVSVLGPVLFLIYVNDLANDLECPLLLFADDAKIFKEIKTPEDAEALKRDMTKIQDWSRKWLLVFNEDICSTLHIGRNNQRYDYELNGEILKKSDLEKDLGVHVSEDLKPSRHVSVVAAKANRIVGLVKKNFDYLDRDTIMSIHCTIIRPILEYAVQSWCPYYKKDIEELEKVQHRVTKLVPGMSDWSYEATCKALELPTLVQRRLRGDMIETYKILRGFEGTDYRKFFKFKDSRTRSHGWKLDKGDHVNTLVRQN